MNQSRCNSSSSCGRTSSSRNGERIMVNSSSRCNTERPRCSCENTYRPKNNNRCNCNSHHHNDSCSCKENDNNRCEERCREQYRRCVRNCRMRDNNRTGDDVFERLAFDDQMDYEDFED